MKQNKIMEKRLKKIEKYENYDFFYIVTWQLQ